MMEIMDAKHCIALMKIVMEVVGIILIGMMLLFFLLLLMMVMTVMGIKTQNFICKYAW